MVSMTSTKFGKYQFASYFASLDIVVNLYRRVKRHLISTRSHEHGQPAEIKPDLTIFTQGVKIGGHPPRPQTWFKSSVNQRIILKGITL
jgi:hypothetical protein